MQKDFFYSAFGMCGFEGVSEILYMSQDVCLRFQTR